MILQPYITFSGNCEEALNFYASCFDGEVTAIRRYAESPLEIPQDYQSKVMHAEVHFENNCIAACDSPQEAPIDDGNNFSLMVTLMEVFVLDTVFNKIAQGGTVTMPLQDTFWGARFGMLTDKFGIRWMFSCDLN
jgi:PhnB protein